jgi:hypothetical protein
MASPLIEAAKFGKSLVRGAGEAASSAKPFYSNIDQAIAAITQPKGTGEQMLAQILKTKGVAAELKYRPEVKAALMQPKVTKEELQKVAADNPPPQIFEKVDKGPSESKYTVEHDELNDKYDVVDDYSNVVKSFRDYTDAEYYASKIIHGSTKYGEYQLPGGENYREIKIMLPKREGVEDFYKKEHFPEPNILAHARVSDRTAPTYTTNDIADIERRLQEGLKIHDPNAMGSGSSIWGVKNGAITPLEAAQISHARGWRSDQTGAVDKILHIEEIQSDWHQAARDIRKKEIVRLVKSGMSKEDAARQVPVDYGYKDIGDAPFKDNWHELVLKRIIDDAVKNGYNKVVISPGAVQVGRYEDEFRSVVDNLSISHRPKDVLGERISVSAEKDGVDTFNYDYEKTKDGWMSTEPIKGQRRTLEETVGKDILKKFESDANYNKTIGSDNSPIRLHNFSGDDITIGGEGMKGFYDDIIPSYLNNYGKQWGATVGKFEIDPTGSTENRSRLMNSLIREGHTPESAERQAIKLYHEEPQPIKLHSYDITPQMRQSITEKGQPLNQIIPAGVGAEALVGQQEEAPEQPEMDHGGVVGMAGGGRAGALKSIGEIFIGKSRVKVRPPSDNVANVRDANFQYPRTIGNQNVNIGDLNGGVRFDKQESQRVNQLADKIVSPDGYISRIIVDHDNNVVEGQHRLEALRKLGATEVPVYKIEDLADTMPIAQMESAIRSVGAIHSDHSHQLMQHVLNDIAEHGIDGAREMDAGAFQKFYDAALDAATPKLPNSQQSVLPDINKAKGGAVGMDAMRMALMNQKVQHKQVGGISRVRRMMAGAPNKTTNIIKEGGGNWLAGGVEGAMKPLKRSQMSPEDMALAEKLSQGTWNPELAATQKRRIEESTRNAPLNQFIDKQITKYIKNQMGTKEDPIRLAADAFPAQKAKLLAAKQVQIDKATADMEKAQQSRGFTPDMMTRSQARIRKLEKEKELIERREGLHFKPYDNPVASDKARQQAGFPRDPVSTTPYGQAWENISDAAIESDPYRMRLPMVTPETAPDALRELGGEFAVQNPNAMAYSIKGDNRNDVFRGQESIRNLGFNHMMDELRNATNAASGLPKDLLIDPKDLSKWTIPQAAEHVDKINAYRASQKAEADLVRANNAATVLHKDYPEKGMKWVELKTPESKLPEGYSMVRDYPTASNWSVVPHSDGNGYALRADNGQIGMDARGSVERKWNTPEEAKNSIQEYAAIQEPHKDELFKIVDASGNSVSVGATEKDAMSLLNRQEREGTLADALKYEGETMGHCVGGYCPDVISGKSRIYSLRDASSGKPHATVEVKPGKTWSEKSGVFYDNPELETSWRKFSEDASLFGKGLKRPSNYILQYPEWLKANDPEMFAKYANVFESSPPSINQIKGPRNAAPSEENLPFVQDFVKSGKWSDVGDFHNTGLMRIAPESNEALYLQKQNKPIPEYVSDQEYEEIRRGMADAMKSPYGAADEMKDGGVAHLDKGGTPETPEQELQRFLRMLRINASGGKDQYGSSVGGKLGLNIPVSENVSIEPYVRGFAYKPESGNAIHGGVGGANLNIRFNSGGKVSDDAMRLAVMNKQIRKHHG